MSSKRDKAAIRARLKYPDEKAFVRKYAPNISKAGIFIKTGKPRPVGSKISFDLQIADGTSVMRGIGEVAWTRPEEESGRPPGMGVKFLKLDSKSKQTLSKVLKFKEAREIGPSRYSLAPETKAKPAPQEPEPDAPAAAVADEAAVKPEPGPSSVKESAPSSKKTTQRAGKSLDLSSIDSMLADIAGGEAPKRRRRKIKKRPKPADQQKPVAREEEPPVSPPPAEASVEPADDEDELVDRLFDQIAEAPPAAPATPARPVEEAEAAEEEGKEEEVGEELDLAPKEPLYPSAASADVVKEEPLPPDPADLVEKEELLNGLSESREVVDDLTAAYSGREEDDRLVPEAPRTVSFISDSAPPAAESDDLDEQLESMLEEPLDLDDVEELDESLGDESLIDLGEDADVTVLDDDEGGYDHVGELINEITRDSVDPPPKESLLDDDDVSDAVEEIFIDMTAESSLPPQPQTFSDNAETEPEAIYNNSSAPPPASSKLPVPEAELPTDDDPSQKKGFFKKLFGG